MSDIPDPGDDFEGCIQGLIDQVTKEIEAVPKEDRPNYFLRRRAEYLAKMIELRAPKFLIRLAIETLTKHCNEWLAANPKEPDNDRAG